MMTQARAMRLGRLGMALAITLAMAAGHASLAADTEATPLRVGIAPNYPPLAFKQDGKLKGIEVEFAERLGKALGRPVVMVETPWDDLPKALVEDKTIDVVMSGTSITEKRKERVDFTEPYMTIGQMVLVRNSDYPRLRGAKQLDHANVRVGFISNTTSDHYAHDHLTHAKLEGFPDADAGVEALRKDKIDAFVVDAPAVWRVSGGLL